MIRTAFKFATVITGFVLAGSSVLHADASGPSVRTYATGLTNPRGLTFGPDGNLYVAEAGTGGTLTPTGDPGCPVDINIYSPLHGRLQRPRDPRARRWQERDGRQKLAQHDRQHRRQLRPDRCRLHRRHALRADRDGRLLARAARRPAAILRVNRDGSTTNVADLNAWHAANPPNFIKDTNPATTDQEPGGVFHSMIAIGKYLYVVETNRGFLLRVDPRTGVIEKLYDMTIDNREHNPS